MNQLRLAWRLLKRDWHVGELRILLSALIIAVASMTSISLFTHRIDLAMNDQSGRFLGADLLLTSPRAIASAITDHAAQLRLNISRGMAFSSVTVANEQFQLAHIKAVDTHYPLRGSVKISRVLYGEDIELDHGPAVGEVWPTARLLQQLQLKPGDTIELGEASFTVTAVLKHDPGQASSGMSIAPRLMMHIDDIEKTGIIQPGSRVSYQQLFAGDYQRRQQFEQWLTPRLNATEKLIGGRQGSPALNSAISKAEQYLSLASMLSVMLAGIAIAMAANRYSLRHFDQTALMRSMGATQGQLVQLYIYQLLYLGTLAGLLGCLLGYLAQQGIILLLADLLPPELPPASYLPLITGFISGQVTLFGFSLPAILRLKSVSPLRVLRRDLTPLPASAITIYGLALASLVAIMWWQSKNIMLTLIVLAGTLLSVLMLGIVSSLLMYISRHLVRRFTGPWRSGMQQLIRHRKANQLQMLAFGLSLMVLLTVLLLRIDLLNRWQAQLPEQAPNHFVINIQPYQVAGVSDFLKQQEISTEGLYPMVRGRITEINHQPVTDIDHAQEDEALKRELNLSWTSAIQTNNKLVAGRWWQPEDEGQYLISLEQGLAQRLGVDLFDEISFQIAEQKLTAQVISLRSVQWDSFQPNFFVIFPPASIDSFPGSFITSFYLPQQHKHKINKLLKQYPGLTVIEIDAVMEQVKAILTQVTLTVEYVMLFVLFAGLMVLLAAIQTSMDERIHTAVIMRTLGAQSAYLKKTQLVEFCMLGLFSGLLAAAGTELIAYGLYRQVFDFEFSLHIWLWLLGPAASMAIILFTGWLSTRRISHQPPAQVLNA